MFEITGSSHKRLGTFYVTLQVTNDGDELTSEGRHEVFVRPRYVERNGERLHDPEFGRSDVFESLPNGKTTIKLRVDEQDLFALDGEGEYTLGYGVVHEFKRWFSPFAEVKVNVKAPKVEVVEETVEEGDEE